MGYTWLDNASWIRLVIQMSDEELLHKAHTEAVTDNQKTFLLSEIKARGLWLTFRERHKQPPLPGQEA